MTIACEDEIEPSRSVANLGVPGFSFGSSRVCYAIASVGSKGAKQGTQMSQSDPRAHARPRAVKELGTVASVGRHAEGMHKAGGFPLFRCRGTGK